MDFTKDTPFKVSIDSHIVTVDDAVKTHKCEYGMVGVVSDDLSLLCQTHTIDAMRLEDIDG